MIHIAAVLSDNKLNSTYNNDALSNSTYNIDRLQCVVHSSMHLATFQWLDSHRLCCRVEPAVLGSVRSPCPSASALWDAPDGMAGSSGG